MLNIAVVGCVHGELDTIYTTVERLNADTGKKTHLILCCGDFQSVRNEQDLGLFLLFFFFFFECVFFACVLLCFLSVFLTVKQIRLRYRRSIGS